MMGAAAAAAKRASEFSTAATSEARLMNRR